MEIYKEWCIIAHDISTGWFSDGFVKLEATISPDIKSMYDFLLENNVANTSFQMLNQQIRTVFSLRNRNGAYDKCLSEKDLLLLNAIYEFANTQKYHTIQKSYAITSISTTGSERTRKRAMDKVKKYIDDNLPQYPRKLLVEYLKNKGLIHRDAEFFYEVLSKKI